MSDYTPGGMSDSEPSMEDILASIRKIIADDSSKPQAPAPGESALTSLRASEADSDFDDILDLADDEFSEFVSSDLTAAVSVPKPAVDAAPFDLTDTADDDDEDILDLTQSLLAADDAPAQESAAQDDTDFDADFDLVLGDDDNEETIALKAGTAMAAAGAAASVIGANAGDKNADISGEILTDIDAMLDSDFDETEFDLDIPSEPEQVIDPAADLIAQDDDDEDEVDDLMADLMARADEPDAPISPDTASVAVLGGHEIVEPDMASASGDADIDLVKSLMAELTEDEDGEFDLITEEADDADAEPDAATHADAQLAPEDSTGSDDIDSDDFDLDDLLSEAEDTPGDMTGIAASAPEQSEDARPVDDDLASIVAQSSADIEAAKTDAAALQDDALDDREFDIAALIDDVPEEDVSDNADNGFLGAAIAGASVLGVGATALAGAGSDDLDDAETGDVTPEPVAPEPAVLEPNALADALPEDEPDVLEDIEVAAESAHEFNDLKTFAAETPATLTDQTFEKDTDMPRIVKTDSIATPETVEAASGAFASLSQVVEEKAVYNESGPRIGDLVQEALKPMLQDWLDKNLKGIVDRAVAKEIKRISSGK